MKRLIVFLLCFVLMPIMSWADICTDPESKEYVSDRRCYVSKEDLGKKPFNAVVPLSDDGHIYCSGVVVKYQGKLYLYTAKHCVHQGKGQRRSIYILDKENDYLSAEKYKADPVIDVAVYSIDEDKMPSVNLNEDFDYFDNNGEVSVIGYGSLKIMTETEIEGFAQKYMEYLEFPPQPLKTKTKGIESGGIAYKNDDVQNFIMYLRDNDPHYYWDIFMDKGLKVSKCIYDSIGEIEDCQAWYGNSGGGVFDANGNVIGIISRGYGIIGGENHGRIATYVKSHYPDYIEKPVILDLKRFLIEK